MTDRLDLAEQMLKRPRRALLVDDDDFLRETLEMGFDDESEIKLTTAPHGEAALKMLNEGERFDCIILDLNLGAGHMDRVDTFRHVVGLDPHVPVAFLTGYPNNERLAEAANIRWHVVYSKPVDFDELKNMICSLVKRSYADA